jgi:hypothetical protein
MAGAVPAQGVNASRALLGYVQAGVLLAIKEAKRIGGQAPTAVGTERGLVVGIVVFQFLEVSGTAVFTADAVQVQRESMQPQVLEEAPCHVDSLSVQCRITAPECLETELMMLSIPASLGTLVSEDGGNIV